MTVRGWIPVAWRVEVPCRQAREFSAPVGLAGIKASGYWIMQSAERPVLNCTVVPYSAWCYSHPACGSGEAPVDICLTPFEARVIGCLIEKHRTTPEHYPLSLNALTNACNQKSNRDPVLELDEATVQDTIDALIRKHYVSEKSGFGSRVTKYQHRFCNTEFGALKFSEQELGIVCVLLLRGPQTPGELRTRTERLCRFLDIHEVESTLDRLMQRDDGPFVMKLPREP